MKKTASFLFVLCHYVPGSGSFVQSTVCMWYTPKLLPQWHLGSINTGPIKSAAAYQLIMGTRSHACMRSACMPCVSLRLCIGLRCDDMRFLIEWATFRARQLHIPCTLRTVLAWCSKVALYYDNSSAQIWGQNLQILNFASCLSRERCSYRCCCRCCFHRRHGLCRSGRRASGSTVGSRHRTAERGRLARRSATVTAPPRGRVSTSHARKSMDTNSR